MKLIQTVRDSIFNPLFYKNLLTTPLKSSIKFFYKLVSILALIGAILLIPKLVQLTNPATYQKFLDIYPRELQIFVQNGKATTNVTEPYFIKNTLGEGKENLAVIDTKTEFSPTQFDLYKTSLILKSEYLATRENNNSRLQLLPLSTFGSTTLNYQLLESWSAKILSLAKYIIPFIVLFVIIGTIIAYSFKLLYLFIAGLLVFFLLKLIKKAVTYKKAYQIALHAMILPLLLQFVMYPFGMKLPAFVPMIILLFIAWVNTKDSVPPVGTIGVTPAVVEK